MMMLLKESMMILYWKMHEDIEDRLKNFYILPPDISFATQHLRQFLHQPKKSHLDSALKVVRYIKGQSGLVVLLQ